jgi:hypothetical protein
VLGRELLVRALLRERVGGLERLLRLAGVLVELHALLERKRRAM